MESLANTWPSAYNRNAGLHEVGQMKRAAAFQLLSLRKQCGYEGLGDTLELVMSKTGVSKRDIDIWKSVTIQEPASQKQLQLGDLRNPDPDEQQKDRLTRTNEWMLGVFYAFPYFIELHRRIMNSENIPRRKSFNSPDIHQWEEHRGSAYETARRTIVKIWFLDSAAMSEEEYAASHVVGSDSEATFRRLDEEIEDEISVDVINKLHETEQDKAKRISEALEAEHNKIINQETAPMLSLSFKPTQGVDLDGIRPASSQEEIPHDLPPSGINRKILAAAKKAVADYCQEPSQPCHD